jgi:hypothetical protein
MERAKILAWALIATTFGPLAGVGGAAAATLAPVGLGHNVALASNSLNWAGYAVTGGTNSVTQVTGSWIEPAVTCTRSTTYAAFWDGIDGFNSNTVEQGGTLAYCSHGSAHYSAWYEFYPAASVTISSIAVHPGDTVSVTVTYSSTTGQFTITVQDGSQSYTQVGSVSGAARSSAECIAERPTVGGRLASLADFGSANFGKDFTSTIGCGATVSGTTGSFGSFSTVSAINMVDSSGRTLASTGPLSSDGTSFTETWVASS